MQTRVLPPRVAALPQPARRCLFILAVLALIWSGLELRLWTWRETTHLRFQHDIVNGYYWGSRTLSHARALAGNDTPEVTPARFFRGYLGLYEEVEQQAREKNYGLDYPPLRLLVMSLWTWHVRHEFPGVEDGTPDYVEPLLHLNVVCEIVSAGAIFLLVRLWLRRASGATGSRWLHRIPPAYRAEVCAMAAATVAWFDPSLILDAHGWPQWDVWILPFYLFAAYAASRNGWFWCGCLLAVGGMLKGQLLFVAPFFVFWPLWQRRWERALRVCAGFAATAAAVVSPWLLRGPVSWGAVVVVAALGYLLLRRSGCRRAGKFAAGLAGLAAFVIGALGTGSFAWWRVGFVYGSEKYPFLFVSSCYNLPSLLADFGWGLKDQLWAADLGPLHLALTPQWALRLLYLGALVLCALGAARHAGRRDARLLAALTAPWLMMFALLGQMHERYLLWGGVVSAVAVGVSMRLTLLNFVISAASTTMILHVMLVDKKLEDTLRVINALEWVRPYASGVILAAVAVWFWETLSTRVPRFRRQWKEPRVEPLALVLRQG